MTMTEAPIRTCKNRGTRRNAAQARRRWRAVGQGMAKPERRGNFLAAFRGRDPPAALRGRNDKILAQGYPDDSMADTLIDPFKMSYGPAAEPHRLGNGSLSDASM